MPSVVPLVAALVILLSQGLGSWAWRRSGPLDDLAVGSGAGGGSALQESEARAKVEFPAAKLALPLVLPSRLGAPPGGVGHIGGSGLRAEVESNAAPGASKFELESLWPLGKDFNFITMQGFHSKDLFLDFLPHTWAPGIDVRGVVLLKTSKHRTVYFAPVKDEPGLEVNIEVTDVHLHNAERALMIMNLLKGGIRGGIIGGNNIISVLGADVGPHFTHFLYEKHVTLDQLFESEWFLSPTAKPAGTKQWSLAVPLSTSVPMVIDMLRGAKDLEALGIIHGHLSPGDIAIMGGRRSAISGLIHACVDSDSQLVGKPSLTYMPLNDDALTSLFWAPLEVEDGIPQGSSTHVWSIGMIFATMCFGVNPVEALYEEINAACWSDLYLSRGRSAVREALSSEFNIERFEDFENLDDDIKTVLLGMLNHEEERWTTRFALKKMEELAGSRKAEGVEVPTARIRPNPPLHWRNDAPSHTLSAGRFVAPSGK